MSLNLDSETIMIRCPHCSAMYEELISRLKYEPKLSCPSCEKYVGVNLLELYTALDSAEKSCEALFQKLAGAAGGRSLPE
ncbi:hypothetical protein [Nitrosospira briensis]|uniref:Uncharacterized protein n=2 Tax=Nitrosospira briensis TaxID=35799 RepID=A0A1I5C3P4_9PROT|nr:hypothetical protein [Nitrosospira briensis]SFN81422.1 hypothetical protein SAMN05216386_1944 [Nitrosospira briensis]SFO38948.1 hypothetical protein SAMN05216332_11331 [Nitrosospira briensis]